MYVSKVGKFRQTPVGHLCVFVLSNTRTHTHTHTHNTKGTEDHVCVATLRPDPTEGCLGFPCPHSPLMRVHFTGNPIKTPNTHMFDPKHSVQRPPMQDDRVEDQSSALRGAALQSVPLSSSFQHAKVCL